MTTKPHWILRTHDGVPTPPEWERGYCVKLRKDSDPFWQCTLRHTPLSEWRWSLNDDPSDIVAVRWLP